MTSSEKQVREALEKQGWVVYTKGWPDFLCLKINPSDRWEVGFVEVKRDAKTVIKEIFSDPKHLHQYVVTQALTEAGIKGAYGFLENGKAVIMRVQKLKRATVDFDGLGVS